MTQPQAQTIHDKLASNYVLVDLTVNSWSGIKTDKDASRRMERHEGAVEGAGKVVKNLLAGNNAAHKAALSAQTQVRTYLYTVSSPWTSSTVGSQKKGLRMVPAAKLMEIMVQLDALISAANSAVDSFLAEYVAARDNAIIALAGLAVASDYPDPATIRDQFGVQVQYKPVPALADYSRMSVPVELAESLASQLADENSRAMQAAQEDAHERLCAQLDRMTDQLTKVVNGDKTKMYETLVTNMREVADVVEASNFSDAPEITAAISAIRDKLVPKHRDKDDFKDEGLARKTLADIQEIRGVIAPVLLTPAKPEPEAGQESNGGFYTAHIAPATDQPEAEIGGIDGISVDNNVW